MSRTLNGVTSRCLTTVFLSLLAGKSWKDNVKLMTVCLSATVTTSGQNDLFQRLGVRTPKGYNLKLRTEVGG